MSEDQEKFFERLVPLKSVLGREFLALQTNRNKHKQVFESSPDKMAADTLQYRRAEIALGRFLDDTIPLVLKANEKLQDSRERLEIAEAKAQDNSRGHGIVMDRRSMQIIWTRFANERYRLFAQPMKQLIKKYHPGMWQDLNSAWSVFRKEIKRWQFGHQPYDGSQAMHSMIDFQMKCRLVASVND